MVKEPVTYNAQAALQMAQMSAITYAQYDKNEGDLSKLKADLPLPLQNALAGYRQVATLYAPEIDITDEAHVKTVLSMRQMLSEQNESHPALLSTSHYASVLKTIESHFNLKKVLFGFALKPTGDDDNALGNVIALRGTRSPFEWMIDALALQVPYDLMDKSKGSVHAGFAALNFILLAQLMTTLEVEFRFFDEATETYVTGHSLGAAVATLMAMDITQVRSGLADGLRMYNFASPRVGDTLFQKAYEAAVPGSFRVVNYADVVPMMPPGSLTLPGHSKPLTYVHAGKQLSYLNDTAEVVGNHGLNANYIPAVEAGVLSGDIPAFPVQVG